MSYFEIKSLQEEHLAQYDVEEFLFKMIKAEYGYGFVPEYHKDIIYMEKCYLHPKRNNFFMALDPHTEKIIGTLVSELMIKISLSLKTFTIPKPLPAYGGFLWKNHGAGRRSLQI